MPLIGGWITGVYRIRNLVNGKVYIGSASRSFKNRWKGHLDELRKGKHSNIYLQRSWDKYGEENFAFEIVEKCHPKLCIEREQYWIDTIGPTDRKIGYNRSPTAGGTLGYKHTEESRAKHRLAAKARMTDETKKRISETVTKHFSDPANREKCKWECTPEISKKMSESAKQKFQDPEYYAAFRERMRDEEYRTKLSERAKGKIVTDETKAKIATIVSNFWQDRWYRFRMVSAQKRRRQRERKGKEACLKSLNNLQRLTRTLDPEDYSVEWGR